MTKVIAITSGKGGVGKTAVVANVASCLARSGKKILILDADLGQNLGGKVLHIGAGRGVEGRKGLVQHHDGAILDQGAGQGQALALPARQGGGVAICVAFQPDATQQRKRAVAVGPVAAQPCAKGDIRQRIGPGQKLIGLGHQRDAPREGRTVAGRDPARQMCGTRSRKRSTSGTW